MSQKPETVFRKKVRSELEKIPKSYWESIQQKSISGTPDILGLINGRFVAIEIKSATGKTTVLQDYKLEKIKAAGGVGLVIFPHNLRESIAYLLSLDEDKFSVV